MTIKTVIPVFCIFILSACATAYQPKSFSGGFSEIQLGENIWRVSFEGNGYTRAERTADLSLLRSAELTLEQGYSYFALAGATSSAVTGAFTTPTTSYTTGSAYSSGGMTYGRATTQTVGGHMVFISKPTAVNTIVMFREKPDAPLLVFDAKLICRGLSHQYGESCSRAK